jgi:hypothetical protein
MTVMSFLRPDSPWRPRRLLMLPVRAYRFFFSPWVGQSCRFEPTCSRYMLEALDRHGALGGLALGGWRVLRCHPWCDGGCDPVPDNPPWRRLRGARAETAAPRPASLPDSPSKKNPQ